MWLRNASQKLIDGNTTSVVDFYAGVIQRQSLQVGDTPCAVGYKAGSDSMTFAIESIVDFELIFLSTDTVNLNPGVNLDSKPSSLFGKGHDNFRLHPRQQLWHGFQYCHFGPGATKHLTQFQRDNTATDKNDGLRQFCQFQ